MIFNFGLRMWRNIKAVGCRLSTVSSIDLRAFILLASVCDITIWHRGREENGVVEF